MTDASAEEASVIAELAGAEPRSRAPVLNVRAAIKAVYPELVKFAARRLNNLRNGHLLSQRDADRARELAHEALLAAIDAHEGIDPDRKWDKSDQDLLGFCKSTINSWISNEATSYSNRKLVSADADIEFYAGLHIVHSSEQAVIARDIISRLFELFHDDKIATAVMGLLAQDPRISVKKLADMLGYSIGQVRSARSRIELSARKLEGRQQ